MIGLASVIVLGLAGHRLWRIAAVDELPWLERARARALGQTTLRIGHEDVKHYTRPALRRLVECPWCLGAYLAVALLAVYAEWPWGARWIVGALAVSEVIGLVSRNLDPVED